MANFQRRIDVIWKILQSLRLLQADTIRRAAGLILFSKFRQCLGALSKSGVVAQLARDLQIEIRPGLCKQFARCFQIRRALCIVLPLTTLPPTPCAVFRYETDTLRWRNGCAGCEASTHSTRA